MKLKVAYLMACSLIVCWSGATVMAGTPTWIGGAGNWDAASNWQGSVVPVDGDDVTITNTGASVTITNSTVALGSLTLSKTLTFNNWNSALNATNVTVQNEGMMTLPAAFSTNAMSNNVYVVCSNFTLFSGGTINVDGKGFIGGASAGAAGHGPGGGGGGGQGGGGGGHGGSGGGGNDGAAGVANGSYLAPLTPGSGGGYAMDNGNCHGGGAVRIQATGRVTLDGTITANGVSTPGRGGAGSGGALYITCNVFGGSTGVVNAKGGNGSAPFGGGGGGGRVAIIYDAVAQASEPKPHVTFLLDGGSGNAAGSPGTLYFSDSSAVDTTWMPTTGVLLIPDSVWSTDSLLIGRGRLQLVTAGAQLITANDITVTGTVTRFEMPKGGEIHCGGHLSLSNGAALYINSAATNGASPTYGALVDVAGTVYIASNSWIYPYSDNTNGGSALLRMANLLISSSGGINADGKGYAGGVYSGTYGIGTSGYGPGRALANGTGGGGAGYGGAGGAGDSGAAGVAYGATNAPMNPGSGGGFGGDSSGGAGGGLVWIEAPNGLVTINGTISAMGVNGAGARGGGGSGGGVFISCRKLAGASAGVLRASAGNGGSLWGGGGGGGRIAVLTTVDTFTGSAPGYYPAYVGSTNGCISVNSGTGVNTGTKGSFFLRILPPNGTSLIVM